MGLGTDTAIVEVTRKLFDDVNNGFVSRSLFLDFSWAFSTVAQLSVYGCTIDILSWFMAKFFQRYHNMSNTIQ